ncbi:MAG: lipoprotein signal peptidase [Bacteroidaceae bacterium]|nr:lipoprotein signal peptidase [Bacteroidaceae bacterium]
MDASNNAVDKDLQIKRNRRAVIWVVVLALIVDQATKILVKTNMLIGNDNAINILPWFKICFIENNGMAFGMEIGGKLFLSLFRIAAIGLIVYLINRLVKSNRFPRGFLVCLAFLVAGATGNILDSMFYGLIFTESGIHAGGVSKLVDFGYGYAPFLYGKVVDMLYFPLWRWPDFIPFIGGRIFFRPVFNIADCCITCSVFSLLLFYRQSLSAAFAMIETESVRRKIKKDKSEENNSGI